MHTDRQSENPIDFLDFGSDGLDCFSGFFFFFEGGGGLDPKAMYFETPHCKLEGR